MIYDFWGCPDPLPTAERGISFYDLTDDPSDPENWRLIAARFPDLADLLPPWYVGSKSVTRDSQSQLQRDLQRVENLDPRSSLADISEALTGERTYGGSVYRRVKAVKDELLLKVA